MFPLPSITDESIRLDTLIGLGILDTEPEERFDRITRLAAEIFGVPIALVSLVDADRQWFKSRVGLEATETAREHFICTHAIAAAEIFMVEDASTDTRFAENPLVFGAPGIRFYAGCPLKAANGQRLGTLCLIDHHPRTLTTGQQAALRDLAAIAENELNAVELNKALRLHRKSQQELDQLRHKFCTMAAHEMRAPLASIHGFAELLLQREFSKADRDDLFSRMFRKSGNLLGMLNKMLDLVRIEAGQGADFDLRPVAPEQLAKVALECLDGPDAARRIHIDIAANLPAVVGDSNQLTQAFVNILSNSLKYSAADTRITISAAVEAKQNRQWLIMTISDCGIGMSPEQMERVCERFYRADPGTTITGSGLGMSIVKEIVELHGGILTINSSLGQGTTVAVSLPIAETSTEPALQD